jgi:putative acetyltransferase
MNSFTITHAKFPRDLDDIVVLFEEYTQWLGIDLAFQDFTTELATLPGRYAPPHGSLLLARQNDTGAAIGCVGLRQLGSHGICEMKRLYVRPTGRGLGVGKALTAAIITEAKRLKYETMRLDTLPTMASARALYKSLGFHEINSYYDTPIEDTVFLELSLDGAAT